MIFNLVKHIPERPFYLIGRYWNRYEKFDELMSLPTLPILITEIMHYPDLYNKIDILYFSSLEGGPVPILEAMLSNCFPIVSNTGFGPDVVTHGENGLFLILMLIARKLLN